MAFQHKLFFGQGRVFSRPVGSTGQYRWWGDLSALSFGGTTEKVKHQESFSGEKGTLVDFPIGGDRTLSGTLHQLDTDAIVQLLNGRKSTIAGGTVTGELLPEDLAAGDYIKLDKPYNVSALSIVDSTPTTPVPLAPSNYVLSAAHGGVEILSIPSSGVIPPFKANYTHAGGTQVALFADKPPYLELRYECLNLATAQPMLVEFYKVSTEIMQELALITSGNAVAGFSFNAALLMDTSKPASGPLGQYGRIVEIN